MHAEHEQQDQNRMDEKTQDEQADWLGALRDKIDAVDAGLLELLNKRAALSLEVGKFKQKTGAPIFRPAREQALLEKLTQQSEGVLPAEHLRSIYREILASSRALQRLLRVAYLGPEGTFSNMACLEYFGDGFTYVPQRSIEQVFASVDSGDCELGVIPLENSLYGTVGESLDHFITHNVFVQAEWVSRIRLSLMSQEESLASISVVYSHPQPLGQCASWLREHLPGARQISVESTAAAAHKAKGEKGSAAIGHAAMAQRLGLSILANSIEDNQENWTRFFVIGQEHADMLDGNRSSIVFAVSDKPGSLASVLSCFANAGVNMTKLESRPMKGERWKYLFFADLDCNIRDKVHDQTLDKVRGYCHSLRVLGAYPHGNEVGHVS